MERKRVLIYASDTPAAQEARKELLAWLRKKKVPTSEIKPGHSPIPARSTDKASLAVVIGGDGTFLNLVRQLDRKDSLPLLGVNLGTVGFITESSRKEMILDVESALENRVPEERRALLQVVLMRKGRCLFSDLILNDAMVVREVADAMLHLEVRVAGDIISELRSDGFIVATATGSTAYALSAGGPILHPTLRAIVMVPLMSHTLASRPVVVPEGVPVRVNLLESRGKSFLVCDGTRRLQLRAHDTIEMRVSDRELRLLKPVNSKWTAALQTKLGLL